MAKVSKEASASYSHWRKYPLDWVRDKFSDSLRSRKITLTGQQLDYFKELGLLVRSKMKLSLERKERPVIWTKEEKSYSKKVGISIMAGKGVGKDFITAMTVLWMLDCFPDSKVPCTGANAKHLRNVLWSEIAKVAGLANHLDPSDPMSKTQLQHQFRQGVERIEHLSAPEKWFAEALTINRNSTQDEQALTVQGRHADAMCFVVDEACSCPDVVFPKIIETLTSPVNFCVMIFNPDRTRSYAISTHMDHQEKQKWVCLHWNAEESELVTREHIENIAKQGRDSRAYRVGVLGLPPVVDSNTLIVPDWVYDAVGRELHVSPYDPVLCGLDVGGGGDKSVICIRQGPKVLAFEYNSDKDMMKVADWAYIVMSRYEARCGFVDIIGLGRGVYDRLNQMGASVRPVDSRNTANNAERFYNRRTECYMKLREQFEQGLISLPDDASDDLKEELSGILYDPEKKCQVERKEEIRKKLGRSPDEADALAISYAYQDEAFRANLYQSYDTKLKYNNLGII